jgi:hypothetical protein
MAFVPDKIFLRDSINSPETGQRTGTPQPSRLYASDTRSNSEPGEPKYENFTGSDMDGGHCISSLHARAEVRSVRLKSSPLERMGSPVALAKA